MPPIILEVHDDNSPRLSFWSAADPDFPGFCADALEASRDRPAPRQVSRIIERGERTKRPPPATGSAPPATPPRPPLWQRLRTLVAECDYRGKQLSGTTVGGCGCTSTWHCAMGKGLPMTPHEVPLVTCFQCVRGEV